MDRWSTAIGIAAAISCAFCSPGPALADEDEQVTERVVVSGDDGDHRVLFIGGDGGEDRVHGEGFHWVHRDLGGDAVVVGLHGAFLGVQLSEMTAELREHFGAPGDAGVLVSRVVAGGPAEVAGIRVGDIITRVDGEGIDSAHGLRRAMGEREEGDEVTLEVYRESSSLTLSATLAKAEGRHHGAHRRVMVLGDRHGEGHPMSHLELHDRCQGLERCEIEISCEEAGECTCKVNGETMDCPDGMGP